MESTLICRMINYINVFIFNVICFFDVLCTLN